MTWKKWRDDRKFDRASKLAVPLADLRVGPILMMRWYFRWVAISAPETTPYQFLRMLEVPAIMVALVAFGIDYADRPIDRATRNAQLLAQVAELATIEHANASGGIKAILEFLAEEKVSMRGIALERTKLIGVDLERALLPFANLRSAALSRANLVGANLTGANLSRADLEDANLTGADLTDTNLWRANLWGAKFTGTNVTQDQLDSACMYKGGKLPTLPEGLKPPQKVCAPAIG